MQQDDNSVSNTFLNAMDFSVQIVALLSALVVAIAAIYVIGLAVRRKSWKDLPIKARICLGAFIMYAPSSVVFFVIHISKNDWDHEMEYKLPRIESSLGTIIWMCIHWQFTAYYL